MAYSCEYPFRAPFIQRSELPTWRSWFADKADENLTKAAEIAGIFKDGKRRLTLDEVPPDVLLTGAGKKLADTFTVLNGARIINEKIRAILEEKEPEVHQIVPIDLTFLDGRQPEMQHYFLNVTQYLDTVIDELSSVEMQVQEFAPPSRNRMTMVPMTSHDLTVSKSIMNGHHLW